MNMVMLSLAGKLIYMKFVDNVLSVIYHGQEAEKIYITMFY